MQNLKLTARERNCILSSQPLDYVPSPKGLGYELYHSMLKNKDAIAQIDAETGKTDTYGSLLKRVIEVALEILDAEVEENDIICQCCSNSLNLCLPVLASLFLGIKVAPIDPSLAPTDIFHVLRLLKPRILFVSSETYELIEDLLDMEDMNCVIRFLPLYDDEVGEEEEVFELIPPKNSRETAVVLCTNGTTGYPKLVHLSHCALMSQTMNMGYNLDGYVLEGKNSKFRVVLSSTSLCWISGLLVVLWSIIRGSARVVFKKFKPEEVWSWLDLYSVNVFNCAVHNSRQLIQTKSGNTKGSLRLFLATGESLTKSEMLALRKIFPRCIITNLYDHTEGSGIIAMYNMTQLRSILNQYEKPSSTGNLTPGHTCKIVDPVTGKIVGSDTPGELRYLTNYLMNGYHPGNNFSNVFDDDGWVRTGDLAFFDKTHCLHVLGRLEDVFKCKSWHIVPSVIEKALRDCPVIRDVAVLGTNQDKNLDSFHPWAYVVLNKGFSSKINADDLKIWANARLPKKQRLDGVTLVGDKEFIRTPTGKARKYKIRDGNGANVDFLTDVVAVVYY